jgi:hypothetical protein
MQDLQHIRFVATNFYNLQGLRAVPLGFLLILCALWANSLQGPARNFLLPALGAAAALAALVAIDRYYLRVFGRIQRTPESLRLEWLFAIAGGILALGGFILDATRYLPVSLLGLVFAAGLLADYLRITWLVKGRFLLIYPLGAGLMAVISLLPVLGLPDWWQAIGLDYQFYGSTIAIGLFTMTAGIWGHLFLVNALPALPEVKNDHAL